MPSLLAGVARYGNGNGSGWQFQLATEVLQELTQASNVSHRGFSASQLVERLKVDNFRLAAGAGAGNTGDAGLGRQIRRRRRGC